MSNAVRPDGSPLECSGLFCHGLLGRAGVLAACGSMRRERVEMARQRFEARKVVRGEEVVDEWERGLHAARQREIVGRTEEWVQPERR